MAWPTSSSCTTIQKAWGDRPVYFAATTNRHRELGLASSWRAKGWRSS